MGWLMDDREFFDALYQLWRKTSGAEDTYWMYEWHKDRGVCYIESVAEDESRKRLASYLAEADADFITAVHGCFGDLWRRLHAALDEADRADYERDSRECRIAELEGEVAHFKAIVDGLSKEPPWGQR